MRVLPSHRQLLVVTIVTLLIIGLIFILSPLNSINHMSMGSCSKYFQPDPLQGCLGYNAAFTSCKCIGFIPENPFPGVENRCFGVEILCHQTGTTSNYLPIN